MRSRYTAYVLQDAAYLRRSWHPSTCPTDLGLDPHTRWLGLKIKNSLAGGKQDAAGTVEFVARFKIGGRGQRMHEISRFTRHQGRWVYLDGDMQKKG